MLNDTLRYLSEIESKTYVIRDDKIKMIYRSFDKPASIIINYTTCLNSKYVFRFCLLMREMINRKPVLFNYGQKRRHQFQIAKGIIAERDQKAIYDLRGNSPLRYF